MDPGRPPKRRSTQASTISDHVPQSEEDAEHDDEDLEDEDDDDDNEVEEPKLKYSRFTEYLSGVYRNGDASSTFLVSGDKMIIGTHNGNIHVFAIPSFQLLRVYHAHTASVTAISVSPYPVPVAKGRPSVADGTVESASAGATTISSSSPSPRRVLLQPTSSNQIHIASSSIDGNVCIASLIDTKDVQVRNFGRPLQSVALSPEYRTDRTYLSGGLAGKLTLTVGGKPGTTSSANPSGSPAATGWLGSLGLGSGNAKDSVLHSGEGAISTIKWSLTGKYVVWVNERGIKIMRSNIGHDGTDAAAAWKRIGHVDRPVGSGWEEMSSVWKCRAEWVDEDALMLQEDSNKTSSISARSPHRAEMASPKPARGLNRLLQLEKLVIGWGGTVWIIQVHPGRPGTGRDVGERITARAEITTIKRFDDCVISGLCLLTPTLLVVLAYITQDSESEESSRKVAIASIEQQPANATPKRHRGLKPELRLIDLAVPDEDAVVSADSLSVNRYQTLSPADYHLGSVLGIRDKVTGPAQKGPLEGIGEGFLLAGQRAAKLLTPAINVRSNGSSINTATLTQTPTKSSSTGPSMIVSTEDRRKAPPDMASGSGMKIYIHSAYDCILAVQRDLRDHLDWLIEQENFKEAWELVDLHPELFSASNETYRPSPSSTPKKRMSVSDSFNSEEAASTTHRVGHAMYSAAEKEKRRLGEEWITQLVKADDWSGAAAVCGKVLGTSERWEHWVWVFAQAGKFEEITPYIPTTQLHPPLPSMVYEYVLGHYISRDRTKLKELLALWPPDLFEIKTITDAINAKLKSGTVREDTVEGGKTGRDWRILMEALAELLVADSRPREALACYMRLKDAESVMSLIRKYNLLDAVSDDVAGFLLLRVSDKQFRKASTAELEEATSEAISLLVGDAIHGTVKPVSVVRQLQSRGLRLFLFFYLRALWNVESTGDRLDRADVLPAGGSSLIDDFGDTVLELFAEYDRTLLLQFLQQSQSYTFEQACAVCEKREYIPELVYLLSKTGETKRALFLIIDKLGDVSQAISFTKLQNDADLWNDLLDYSMDKPRFIRGLLEEVGTAIDPVTLVRRIPEGLEVEGLKTGLSKILKEYELQYSISEGVARILRGEVALGMETARARQKKAVKFDVGNPRPQLSSNPSNPDVGGTNSTVSALPPGRCIGCDKVLQEDETDTLVGFLCEHVFHLTCLLNYNNASTTTTNNIVSPSVLLPPEPPSPNQASSFSSPQAARTVGAKVTRARLLRDRIQHGCPVDVHTRA